MAAPSMNAIADRFTPRDVGSIFLYTHEAHPGENYPHLTSMAQKLRHARDLRDKLGVTRSILVDALDGACHRAYGSMPNMTWIIARSGVPVYKSDWTDHYSVANAWTVTNWSYIEGKRPERNDLLIPGREVLGEYTNPPPKVPF
jgi:hypothetical protein